MQYKTKLGEVLAHRRYMLTDGHPLMWPATSLLLTIRTLRIKQLHSCMPAEFITPDVRYVLHHHCIHHLLNITNARALHSG